VTEIPGTTRDVLREWIDLEGIPAHVVDTAGIRETQDSIEIEGVKRARGVLASADLVLLVVDASSSVEPQTSLLNELPDPALALMVFNKIDLLDRPVEKVANLRLKFGAVRSVAISAKTGTGLKRLKAEIREMLGASEQSEGSFSARQRHVEALRRTATHLAAGERRFVEDQAPELLAEELRLAQQALGEITGEMLPDDLLGAIFASFCIGK